MKKMITAIWLTVISFVTFSAYSEIPADNATSPMLYVRGNKIHDEKGLETRLWGVNVCSLEWSNRGENVSNSVYEAFANWNCNIVRLPLSQDRWFGKAPGQSGNSENYRQIVDDVVRLASDFSKYVILDLHWSNTGILGRNIGQHHMPDDYSLEFWIGIAQCYANNPAVLFNLYNEPHNVSWEIWRNGGRVTEILDRGKTTERSVSYTTPGHQKIVDAIRKNGANNIIIAGGLDWAYDLRGITNYALADTPSGNGIMYDSHIYPWQEWDGNNHQSKVLCIADDYPIIIDEIGINLSDGNNGADKKPAWLSNMLDWIDANGLHWTGWSFHPSATPNMISDWKYTPTPHHGAVLKARLLSYPDTNAHLKLPKK
jgi:hypothetical protein